MLIVRLKVEVPPVIDARASVASELSPESNTSSEPLRSELLLFVIVSVPPKSLVPRL